MIDPAMLARGVSTGQLGPELLRARAYLSSVAEPPAPALAEFIAEVGPVRAAEQVRSATVPSPVAEEVGGRSEQVRGEDVLAAAEAVGARLVVPEHPEWPKERFSCLAGAASVGIAGMAMPLALWVRDGPRSLENSQRARLDLITDSVAIVGARAASGYGEHIASELGHAVTKAGFTVISGAAYGIDGAAHRGALAAGHATVAFLACGVDIDYPAGHARLLATIAERGLVVSEYPPGTPPRKHRFLVRNRLIAASGQGTVVVEAGARSGAANTVHTADALGRPVMAVPGPVTSASSVGCHQMVRTGKAVLVTQPTDVLEVISPLGTRAAAPVVVPARRTDDLDWHSQRILDAVAERDATSAERIAQDCGLPLRKVRALLPALEISGFITRKEDGWVRGPE